MTDNVENLLLEHLKAIRADLGSLKADLKENTQRLGRVEVSLVSLRRDSIHVEEGQVEQDMRLDRLAERLERIERRLELS